MIETNDQTIEHANKAKVALHRNAISEAAAAAKAAERLVLLDPQGGDP